MTDSLYDILGVEASASESEIKGAWRSLVTVLGPTDHRFAAINDAASVLLDADKRAAYDASLAESAPSFETEAQPTEAQPTEAQPTAEESSVDSATVDDVEAAPDTAADEQPAPVAAATSPTQNSIIRILALPRVAVVAAALAVALVVATGISYAVHDNGQKVSQRTVTVNLTDANVKPITQNVQTRETADVTAALSAAVTATPKILNFDYKTIDAWEKTATPYMTPNFIKTYMPYFDGMVKPNAQRVHGVVKLAPVLDAGVVSTAPGVVVILVIVDAQTATANQTVIAQDFAVLTMAKTQGRWLVDKFGTAPIPK